MVVNMVSDTLSGVGSSTVFTGDTDIQLVGDALPFAVKVYEALLEQNPDHAGLIVTTGSLFVMYANAYVQGPADMARYTSFADYAAGRERAKALYLRGAAILNHGLELRFPGITEAIASDATVVTPADRAVQAFLPKVKAADVPLIYWTVAGTLSAYALNPMDLTLGMKLGPLYDLINQAYIVDPDYSNGTLDDFFILFHSSVPASLGGKPELVPEFFEKALSKSGGHSASPYVSYAEAVCIPSGDYDGFKSSIDSALSVDVDAEPSIRLMNLISQRKAQFLLDNQDRFFVLLNSEDDDFWDDEDWNENLDSEE
jgi:predicted anti-sigma-YlaC factor YlaD